MGIGRLLLRIPSSINANNDQREAKPDELTETGFAQSESRLSSRSSINNKNRFEEFASSPSAALALHPPSPLPSSLSAAAAAGGLPSKIDSGGEAGSEAGKGPLLALQGRIDAGTTRVWPVEILPPSISFLV